MTKKLLNWVGAVLLLLAVAAVPCCASPAAQRPPKDTAEAEKWVRELYTAIKGWDVEFDIANGTMTGKTPNGPNVHNLVLVTWVGPVTTANYLSEFHWTEAGDPTDWWFRATTSRIEKCRLGFLFLVSQAQHDWDTKEETALAAFKVKADAWRALAEKPKIPDSAYPHQVLAEDAYKNQDLPKALKEYVLALKDFPMWPEGQFNAAYIASELKNYRIAVMRMKCYLMLKPDAPDAKAAKDNIIIWQDKIPHF